MRGCRPCATRACLLARSSSMMAGSSHAVQTVTQAAARCAGGKSRWWRRRGVVSSDGLTRCRSSPRCAAATAIVAWVGGRLLAAISAVFERFYERFVKSASRLVGDACGVA